MAKNEWECWETDGTYEGKTVYCPTNAYGDCPYCSKYGVCHNFDPIEECDDFYDYYGSWEEYLNTDLI